MKVYYAHSIALYGKAQEARDVTLLQQLGFEVVNPNAPEHAAGYEKSGMSYFDAIVDACDVLAFRANADGSINAGVAHEIEAARDAAKPVLELPCGVNRRSLSVDQTRAYLRESGAR